MKKQAKTESFTVSVHFTLTAEEIHKLIKKNDPTWTSLTERFLQMLRNDANYDATSAADMTCDLPEAEEVFQAVFDDVRDDLEEEAREEEEAKKDAEEDDDE